jgi:predicted Fe-Mo cluster-binding NifX family protein
MKVAVSATGPGLDAQVDPRFGRCQYFNIFDPDTMESETVENKGAVAGGGAGIATAQTITGKGIEAVLTGNCGPNAFQVLSAAGIKVITGVSGTVRDVVLAYRTGNFEASSQPNVPGHFGMGGGMGRGGGMGGR